MGRILKFIEEATEGECFTSFKYSYDNDKVPGIEYETQASNPQPPSKNEIELKEKEATQKKRLKEVKIATRRHKIPLPHNAT